MKVGDLVKFHNRFFRDTVSRVSIGAPSGVYLVIRRLADKTGICLDKPGRPVDKWTRWEVMNTETGKIYNQIGRDFEVISESR